MSFAEPTLAIALRPRLRIQGRGCRRLRPAARRRAGRRADRGFAEAPLDLVLVRKIGVPFQPELAMGAVADGGTPVIVRNDDVIAMADVERTGV